VLSGDRIASWSTAGLQSVGGVPSAKWPVCNATPLTPGGGDDAAAINAAIQGCPAGSVVQLGPGTFTMGKGNYVALTKGVALRGAGAGKTILKNPLNVPATPSSQSAADTTPIVIVGPGRWNDFDGDAHGGAPTAYQPAFMQLLTSDGAAGSSTVTVGDPSLFSKGQLVLVDETSNAGWQPDAAGTSTSIWASSDYAVTWERHSPQNNTTSVIDDPVQTDVTPTNDNNFAGSGTGNDAASWFCRQDRPQNEIKEIASVSGNKVTFATPLSKAYRTANHAELTTFTGANAHVRNAGVEALTLAGGGDGALRFENAAYSWARNVEVTGWYGEGVAIDRSFRVEVRDSYIHDAAWAEPGGAGYSISLAEASSEVLLENDISIRANKVIVARSSGTSSVLAYSYLDEGYIATTEGWIEAGINGSHMVGAHHMLFEGNEGFNMDSDSTHGNSTYQTYFRNYVTTVRSKFTNPYTGDTVDDRTGSGGPRRAASPSAYSYNLSFLGNVMGDPTVVTAANGYVDEETTSNWGGPGGMIWLLGWNPKPPYTPDPHVAENVLRDGNWDSLLGKQTWLNGKATTLPDSLYLASKPAFFGSSEWPWVDPTTGTVHTLPAKARYDAGTPNIVP
jgi:hypothetical protein